MRRLYADQLLELRGLRGKSSGKVQLMLQRVQAEAAEFEQCTARLAAMRSVHARMLKDALAELSADRVRQEVDVLQQVLGGSWLPLGAKKTFVELCARLRSLIEQAQQRMKKFIRCWWLRLPSSTPSSVSVWLPTCRWMFASMRMT